ncbi:hypothetical protein LCGC14_0316770 [marine sediment metagenome]|uniref:Uncharacterized protein n=1 Tax=marine sediment metagenome TaxID=412755 RepID=A0A0F9TKQ0_9ZZZZ
MQSVAERKANIKVKLDKHNLSLSSRTSGQVRLYQISANQSYGPSDIPISGWFLFIEIEAWLQGYVRGKGK